MLGRQEGHSMRLRNNLSWIPPIWFVAVSWLGLGLKVPRTFEKLASSLLLVISLPNKLININKRPFLRGLLDVNSFRKQPRPLGTVCAFNFEQPSDLPQWSLIRVPRLQIFWSVLRAWP